MTERLGNKNKQKSIKTLACYIRLLTAFLIAGIGPVPMTEGSRPAWAHDTILAMGFTPRLAASDWLIRTVAAAPSFIPADKNKTASHLLQTLRSDLHNMIYKLVFDLRRSRRWRSRCHPWWNKVWVWTCSPCCFRVEGTRPPSPQLDLKGRGKKSFYITDVKQSANKEPRKPLPFLDGTMMGTISWSKCPAFCAASVLFWDLTANWSCFSRLMPHCFATFSADRFIWKRNIDGYTTLCSLNGSIKVFHTRDPHVIAMEGISQAISDHGVIQRGIPHFHPGSHVQSVRSLRRQRKPN